MRDQHDRPLHVRVVPWSSVVSQSLTISTDAGRVVGQLQLLQIAAEPQAVKDLAHDLAVALNRADLVLRVADAPGDQNPGVAFDEMVQRFRDRGSHDD